MNNFLLFFFFSGSFFLRFSHYSFSISFFHLPSLFIFLFCFNFFLPPPSILVKWLIIINSCSNNNNKAYRPVAGQRSRNGGVQPLLCNTPINKHLYLRTVGKRVPTAVDTHAAVEVLLDYNNGVFYMVGAEIL
jgi:hypothetical protein